ncbi:MAG TPA: MerR family transcriptional regulator [Burkholderiaceae bacterium]|jgi:MerR family redox-sensitive transcriptional activator SoxR|nr:MerR family transcriptional regulator [Burkholderiaceae bacterium]
MRIGELARKSGFASSTIRYYERVGVLRAAARQNGQRHFAAEVEHHLSVIAFARRAGFTLTEIRDLFHGFEASAPASHRWRKLGRKKIRDIDQLVARLQRMQKMLKGSARCRCVKLEDCGRLMRAQILTKRPPATLE